MPSQKEVGLHAKANLQEFFKNNCGQPRFELLPPVVHALIFQMTSTKDLKAVRLTSKTMRQRVEYCEKERFKQWKLRTYKSSELTRLSEEVRTIKGIRVQLHGYNILGQEDHQNFLDSLKALITRHREIESLELRLNNFNDLTILNEMIECSGHVLKSLELHFCAFPLLNKDGLPRLEEICFHECNLTDMNVKSIIQDFGSTLTYLELSDSSIIGEGVIEPGTSLPTVKSLRLMGYFGLFPRSQGCYNLSDQGLFELLAAMPNLENLYLPFSDGLTEDGIVNACQALTKLSHLDIRHFVKLCDYGLQKLLCIMPHLEYLDLPKASLFTGEGIARVCRPLIKLKWVDLGGCFQLTNQGLGELLSLMPNLENFTFAFADKLTGRRVAKVCKSLPRLAKMTFLDISGCDHLTEYGLKEMIAMMPKLEKLVLEGVEKIPRRYTRELEERGIKVELW